MAEIIKCKAAICWGPKQPLQIETIQVDPPQAMEVRIKIVCTSLCHTDLTFWVGLSQLPSPYPRIFGHEGAGIVESGGEGVKDLKKGDHVIPLFNGECGECERCISPNTNLCKIFMIDLGRSVMRSDGKPRFSIQGKPVYHFFTSTFSEYTVVDSACVAKISHDITFDRAALFACGLTTGVGAAVCAVDVKKDSSVVVFGLGGVGLAVVDGARIKGASTIIGVDINPYKFETARRLGATVLVNPKEHDNQPLHKVIQDIVEGGADYCFECTGNMEILYEAFLATKEAPGTTVMIGFDATGRKISLDPLELLSGRKLIGTVFGGVKGKTRLPSLALNKIACISFVFLVSSFFNVTWKGSTPINSLYEFQEIRWEEHITHRMPISEINESFNMMQEGKCLRCILSF